MVADRQKSKTALNSALLPALLFFTVLATFSPCLWNGFVDIDDPVYLTKNTHVIQGFTWAGFQWAWTSGEAQNWHPLTWICHMLDVQLFGLKPAGHHATNIFLHALNTAILFLLLQKLTGARWRSFAVAALFGLHPLRVESVAWVAELKDVLSVLFWLLTTWAYVRYTEARNPPSPVPNLKPQKKPGKLQPPTLTTTPNLAKNSAPAARWYWASVTLFACGLLSKPMLVTLPFALLLLDYWPLRRWPQKSAKQLVLEKVPFLILAAASSVVTYLVQQHGGAVTPLDTLSLSARLANVLVSYLRYIGMSFWPAHLCVMYLYPGHWPAGTVLIAGFVLAGVSALAVWQRQSMPYLAVGWFWFLGTLVPAIGIVQVGRQALADRYTYLPSIGFWLAVVWSISKLTEKWRHREFLAWAAGAIATAACIGLTVHQIGFWKDGNALYARARDVAPGNWVATAWLANLLQREGETDNAVAMYKAALQIKPRRTEIRCRLGDLLAGQKRYDEALAQFQTAVDLDPSDVYAHDRLAGISQNMGKLDAAINEFNDVLRLDPSFADAYSDLGNCYGMKGRTDDAIRCFEQAVKLKPLSGQNHRELGVGLAVAKRWNEAIAEFQQALQLDPTDTLAQGCLNTALQARAGAGQVPPP